MHLTLFFRNSSTIIKLQEIKDISFYWNTMSEMFIPKSVVAQSKGDKYGIFSLLPAEIIHDMMKDIFSQKMGMSNSYLIEPFSIRIQMAFRNSYNPAVDAYKY